MKLLHIESRSVVELPDTELPPYAILSYTRAGSLCTTQAQLSTSCKRHICSSFQDQVTRACDDTISRGITYLWVQSLCINASSSAELDDGVNGSFRRLIRSSVCLVYLADLPTDGPSFDKAIWAQCAYWRRAWTLQELILPSKVEFFDKQWNYRGSKASPELLPLLSNITGIPKRVLLDPNALSEVSLAGRMSWAVDRIASREEDTAYSLGAITGVTIPVRYGEGAERAFLRLQEEILHDTRDGSIFAWRSVHNQKVRGLLARSPSEFRHFAIASGSAWSAMDLRWQSPVQQQGHPSSVTDFQARIMYSA
ncbi:hypothetical protein EDB80DRAFT_768290 [Ilyonectria destructans]|nr:hypothetical protein EDB80DRAFT_768290 [Ilyonectria destructans]